MGILTCDKKIKLKILIMVSANELTIGKPIKWRGWITSWSHVPCSRCDDPSQFVPSRDIYGFDKLSSKAQEEVSESILSTTAPSVETIDPTDEAFAKISNTLPQHRPPNTLLPGVTLLPYQREGLGFLRMREREKGVRGGVLADEMGMGKTLQMLALIALGKEDEENSEENQEEEEEEEEVEEGKEKEKEKEDDDKEMEDEEEDDDDEEEEDDDDDDDKSKSKSNSKSKSKSKSEKSKSKSKSKKSKSKSKKQKKD